MTTQPRYLTIRQTCEATGMPDADVCRDIAQGRIPVTVIPGTSVIRVDGTRLNGLDFDDAKDEQ